MPRVLIVEDEPRWQRALLRCDLLSQMKREDAESVVIVADYESAKNQLDSICFDLAITDVILGKDEGEFDWRALADLLQRKKVPTIVVSAYLDVGLVSEAVNEYGAIGIFDKYRLDLRRFAQCVKRVLGVDMAVTLPSAPLGYQTVTWLHLSDLHFKQFEQHDRGIVIESLWRDLDRCRGRALQPDFAVVTGDVAYSGNAGEYELAARFFDDLLEEAGIPKKRLFVVPGNHDVDRSGITGLARDVETFQNRDSVRRTLEDYTSRSLFLGRLDGYASFLRSYFSDSEEPLVFDANQYFYSRTFAVDHLRIAILGLNSVWTSGTLPLKGQAIEKGHLVVGEKQAMDALRVAQDAHVRIAAMHHPLSYLQDHDARDVDAVIRRGCHFLLHGHLHEPDVERTASLKGGLVVIPAGALYRSRERVNSYNYAVLDYERSNVRIVFRRYSDVQQEWLKDLDATGEERDGELRFDLQMPLPA